MDISKARVQIEIFRLFTWWIGELSSLIPSRIFKMLSTNLILLTIDVFDTEIKIGRFQGDSYLDLAHVKLSFQDSVNDHDVVKKIAKQQKVNQIIFRIPEAKSMVRIIQDLPQSMENNLEEALFFELERLTPFHPEDLLFDYHLCEKNIENKTITVQLAMIPKIAVSELKELGKLWGVEPDQIDLVGDDASKRSTFNFLKSGYKNHHSKIDPFNKYILLVIILSIALIIFFPIIYHNLILQSVNRQIDHIKSKAETALFIRHQIDDLVSEQRFLSEFEGNHPAFAEILEVLTKILPNDTWIIRLGVFGTSVKISGYAKTASQLVKIIEESKIFKNVVTNSSFVRDSKLDRERFEFSFRYDPKEAASR